VSLRAKACAACSCSRTRLQWVHSFGIGHPWQPCAYCCLLEERRSSLVTLAHAAAAASPALLQPLPTASFPHSSLDTPHRSKTQTCDRFSNFFRFFLHHRHHRRHHHCITTITSILIIIIIIIIVIVTAATATDDASACRPNVRFTSRRRGSMRT
jgi:hypothetical protein